MANGSLDKWIFNKTKEEFVLDWDTRYNIALGTKKDLLIYMRIVTQTLFIVTSNQKTCS